MFLIDHNYILSVSDDNCLRLWSIIDRSLISVLETNQSTKWFTRGLDEVYSALLLGENIIKFWKTNKTEYFIESDFGIKLLNVSESQTKKIDIVPHRKLTGNTETAWRLIFSKDTIITCAYESSITIWDRNSYEEVSRLNGHSLPVNCICLSSSKNILYSGSEDKIIKIWSLDLKIEIGELIGHTDAVYCIGITKDEKILISSGKDLTVRFWNLDQKIELIAIKEHSSCIYDLSVHPYHKIVATGGEDKTLKFWNIEEPKLRKIANFTFEKFCFMKTCFILIYEILLSRALNILGYSVLFRMSGKGA